MEISILTCPQCNAMVLSDAGRCHVCDHVLDQERVQDDEVPSLPTDHAVAEDLETCRGCGETYRRGLVRCWNCGVFTRDEIKAAYDVMTSNPERYTPKEYSGSTEIPLAPQATQRTGPWRVSAMAASEPSSAGGAVPPSQTEEELSASDDDFSFELADSVQLTQAAAAESGGRGSETYGLAPGAESASSPDAAITPETSAQPLEIPTAREEIPALETTADEAPSSARGKATEAVPDVAHSEATGGDLLLDIARQEESDMTRSRRSYAEKVRGGFVVFCPMGCRIRVQDRHRGKAGKCPKCHSVFFVPRTRQRPKVEAADAPAGAAVAVAPADKWRGYLSDLHLHTVVPQKLRIKADSLLKEFTNVDVVFSDEGLLLATLVTSPGFLGANLKKKPALREALQGHLKSVGTATGAPAAQTQLIPKDGLGQLAMAQPAAADVESLFGNIPVFGVGRIAVRLPRAGDDPATQYLSFSLSEFRTFVDHLEQVCGFSGLGADTEVPLAEVYNTVNCHYSESPVRELLGLEYYKKDPLFKLQITGWRCQGCALVVSEDSRKKEKIGGLNGKKIATAKCPKCGAKYGSHPLHEVAPTAVSPAPAAETGSA